MNTQTQEVSEAGQSSKWIAEFVKDDDVISLHYKGRQIIKSVKEIVEALAQPAQKNEASSLQELVSLGDFDRMTKAECVEYIDYLRKEIDLLRFKEWQGLSDDVVMQTYLFIFNDDELEPDEQVIQFYKMIEAKLKEKNHG